MAAYAHLNLICLVYACILKFIIFAFESVTCPYYLIKLCNLIMYSCISVAVKLSLLKKDVYKNYFDAFNTVSNVNM